MSLLNEMEVFYYVSMLNSFSKAAKVLKLSKGYVSLQVNSLESHLGVRLLHRTTRHLSLTEAGQAFFISCEKIVREKNIAKSLIEGVKHEPAGRLRISAPPSMCSKYLAYLIPKFMSEYPKISIELDASARIVDLIRDEIDIAIRISKTLDENYIAKLLTNLTLYICASPDYLKKHGAPKKPEDLIDHNCLVYSSERNNYFWNFINKNGNEKKETKINVTGNLACNNESVIYEALLAGVGIAKLPNYILHDAIKEKKVVVLLEEYYETSMPLYAVYPSLNYTSPKVTRFLTYLKDDLEKMQTK